MIKKVISFLLSIIFPKPCVQCGEYGEYICDDCFKKIRVVDYIVKKPLGHKYKQIFACTTYQKMPSLRKLIKLFKYKGIKENGNVLALIMFKRFNMISRKITDDFDFIVSVPMHKKRKLKRIFNHAEVLAKNVSSLTNIKYLDCIVKNINTPQQAKLNARERHENVKNSFIIKKSEINYINDKNLLIIDDVSTTGATLHECSKILIESGARSVTALVLAKSII